jgi:hypothetical protein
MDVEGSGSIPHLPRIAEENHGFSKDSRYPDRDSNRTPSEYKSEAHDRFLYPNFGASIYGAGSENYNKYYVCGLLGYNTRYQTTRCHNPESQNNNFHHRVNLKYHITITNTSGYQRIYRVAWKVSRLSLTANCEGRAVKSRGLLQSI